MRQDFVTCVSAAGYHRMAYTEWGSPDAERVLICVHGLTRTRRDFDFLAAAMPGTPIRRMIVNDVGPLVPKAALERIAAYVGLDPRFKDMWQAGRHIREAYAPFGRNLSEAQWDHLTCHTVREVEEGGLALCYDPAIAQPFQTGPIEDVDLWAVWDAIQCPTLVLRGADTDLLLPETADEMTRRGPKAQLVEFENCGHAPSLMEAHQIDTIRSWLLRDG